MNIEIREQKPTRMKNIGKIITMRSPHENQIRN